MFGDDASPDIDVIQIFDTLEPGFHISVLCEGCGLIAVEKEEVTRKLVLIYQDIENFDNEEAREIKTTIEQYEKEVEGYYDSSNQ